MVAGVAVGDTFKIGSAAPENTPWGRALNRLAAEWHEISNGEIEVVVYHGAIAGDESQMVRQARLGRLQAVVMTNTGLSAFSDGVMTLSMPLLIRDQDEYDYVFEHVREELEADIARHQFRVISWSMAGWLYFFSADTVRTPADLRQVTLAASPEEADLIAAYELMGYQAEGSSYTERLTDLASGRVDAFLTVPILAAAFQWFGATPNMLGLTIGPAPGAIVITESAYRRLPRDIRDELMAVADSINQDLTYDIAVLEAEAIDVMRSYGLSIAELSDRERQLWIEELEASYDVTLDLVFDQGLYETIRELLDEYRQP